MPRMKLALMALAATALAMPATANSCYVIKLVGGQKSENKRAQSVLLTFKNKSNSGIATFVEGPDHPREKIWIPKGEKERRKIHLDNSDSTDDEFRIDYSPSASPIDLLDFDIKNGAIRGPDDRGRFPYSQYTPYGSGPNNVVCDRVWRRNKQRWDIDITYK